jgi:hypothetical protein
MAEFGLTTEMLDFNIDDFSVEELREKFEALKTTGSEPAANAGNPESFALEGQFRDELFGALESEKVETCWGMDSHYWFWDYDRDASEVYATDVTDWNLYGFPYSMDGDHVVIDFAGKKRMKLSLVPFDEGGQTDPISGMFAKITEKYSANDTQWAEKYQTASDTISSMENELGTLRQFKTDTEDAAAKQGSAVPSRQNAVNSNRLMTYIPSTISPSLMEISIDSSVMPSSLIFLYASWRFQIKASTHKYSWTPELSSISSHQYLALSGITPTG